MAHPWPLSLSFKKKTPKPTFFHLLQDMLLVLAGTGLSQDQQQVAARRGGRHRGGRRNGLAGRRRDERERVPASLWLQRVQWVAAKTGFRNTEAPQWRHRVTWYSGSGGAIGGKGAGGGSRGGFLDCGRHFGSIDEAMLSAVLRGLDTWGGGWSFFVDLFCFLD